MLSLHVRARIRELLRRGLSLAAIAREMRVSLSSIKRIAKEPETKCLDDVSERRRRRIGRPSVTCAHRAWLVETLRMQPQRPTVELLAIARERGYSGSKSTFYVLVNSIRPSSEELEVGREAAAESSQPVACVRRSLVLDNPLSPDTNPARIEVGFRLRSR